MAVGLFPQATSNRKKRKWSQVALRVEGGNVGVRVDIRKRFFREQVVKQWNRLPMETVESPPLEIF